MNRRFLSLATCGLLLTGIGVSSCHSRAAASGTSEVEGILLLKGNEPHVYWVLAVSDTEQWELAGLNSTSVRSLQTQRVKVKGRVRPDARSASLLPTLLVIEITPLTN